MSSPSQLIAFFGATGGCTNACLTHTLQAGFHATALARTPTKLTTMLLAQGLSQSVLDSQLTIVKGDIANIAAIKAVLTKNTAGTDHVELATQIVSGLGAAPIFFKSVTKPVVMDNPNVCEQASQNIVQALTELHHDDKPTITVVSSTGISDVKEDVPFGLRFLYHVVLKVPHQDKKRMDEILNENAATSSEGQGVLKGVIVIRASLLTGDQDVKGGKGWKKLKVGTEDKPAIGYTVRRQDVGEWIFQEIIKTGGESRLGQRITLTN
ncbi:hypothetical protein EMPS_08431 [Entomortierella parvispora]|uniref:NAD(P)-binding domain-containing protein n=1 Tax=Entomortierella parvispora TaxID=205924 RepID=A0A9P3LZF2_9FUNG|nr:hypothetical protein EMPS_08431 [Entomortierella parvispora]